MWKKIDCMDDFNKMKKNGALAKYPNLGEPVEKIDEEDKKNLKGYLIDSIKFNEIELLDEEIGRESIATSVGNIKSGVLHKGFQQMIDERRWWYKSLYQMNLY